MFITSQPKFNQFIARVNLFFFLPLHICLLASNHRKTKQNKKYLIFIESFRILSSRKKRENANCLERAYTITIQHSGNNFIFFYFYVLSSRTIACC